MMDPGYLMAPLLMGHVTSLVQSIKTGNVLMDCLLLFLLLILYYKRRYLTTNVWQRVPSFYGWACRITIAAQETSNGNSSNRSLRFRALMHYLASRNQHVYQLREITEFEYLREMDEHHRRAYNIAVNHLESSFDIYRSNGFKEWKQTRSAK